MHIGRLPNSDNDARDMSAALRRLGFEVTTEFDADRVELTEALRAFTRRIAGADVSLVFYAGHGIEMDGVNYLVPVDARLERDVDVRFETVTVDDVLVSTSGAALPLVILDDVPKQPAGALCSSPSLASTRSWPGTGPRRYIHRPWAVRDPQWRGRVLKALDEEDALVELQKAGNVHVSSLPTFCCRWDIIERKANV